MKRGKQRVRLDLLPPDQFQSLIEAVKHKEETAWRFFFERYAPFTDQFIEDSCFRTDQPLREGIDPCDIRQLTFMSLLRYRAGIAAQEGQFIKDLCLLAWKQFHRYCRWATAYKRSLQLQIPFVLVRHDKPTRAAGPAESAACADASRHSLAGISEQVRATSSRDWTTANRDRNWRHAWASVSGRSNARCRGQKSARPCADQGLLTWPP